MCIDTKVKTERRFIHPTARLLTRAVAQLRISRKSDGQKEYNQYMYWNDDVRVRMPIANGNVICYNVEPYMAHFLLSYCAFSLTSQSIDLCLGHTCYGKVALRESGARHVIVNDGARRSSWLAQ